MLTDNGVAGWMCTTRAPAPKRCRKNVSKLARNCSRCTSLPELTINEEAVNRWFDRITAGLSDAQRVDLKRKFAKKGAIYGAAGRLELIAWDIATHFSDNIKGLNQGLKGQVATESKLDAIR